MTDATALDRSAVKWRTLEPARGAARAIAARSDDATGIAATTPLIGATAGHAAAIWRRERSMLTGRRSACGAEARNVRMGVLTEKELLLMQGVVGVACKSQCQSRRGEVSDANGAEGQVGHPSAAAARPFEPNDDETTARSWLHPHSAN